MFYGRNAELKFLEDKYNSSKSELIVIYGRRIIGKIELFDIFKTGKQTFFMCSKSALMMNC